MSANQTTFRSKRTRDYTTVPNELARDRSLSFKARGILLLVLSHCDEWTVHQSWLEEQGLEGREAIRSAMRELVSSGYALYEEFRDGGRFLGSRWTFYDCPLPVGQRGAPPNDGKPSIGKPSDGKPSSSEDYFPETNKQKPMLPVQEQKPIPQSPSPSAPPIARGSSPSRRRVKASQEEVVAHAVSIGLSREQGRKMFLRFEGHGWPRGCWRAVVALYKAEGWVGDGKRVAEPRL